MHKKHFFIILLLFCGVTSLKAATVYKGWVGVDSYCFIDPGMNNVVVTRRDDESEVRVHGDDLKSQVKVVRSGRVLLVSAPLRDGLEKKGFIEVFLPNWVKLLCYSNSDSFSLIDTSLGVEFLSQDGTVSRFDSSEKESYRRLFKKHLFLAYGAMKTPLSRGMKSPLFGKEKASYFFKQIKWYLQTFSVDKKRFAFDLLKRVMTSDSLGTITEPRNQGVIPFLLLGLAEGLPFIVYDLVLGMHVIRRGIPFHRDENTQYSFGIGIMMLSLNFLLAYTNHLDNRRARNRIIWDQVKKSVENFDMKTLGKNGELFVQDVEELKKLYEKDKSEWREGLADLSAWVAESAAEKDV